MASRRGSIVEVPPQLAGTTKADRRLLEALPRAVALYKMRKRGLHELPENMTPELIEAARRDMRAYIQTVLRTDTGLPAVPPRHLRDQVLAALMDDSMGHTVIVAPPSSAKTTATMAAMGHWIGNNPSVHIGLICNTGSQAALRSAAVRDTVRWSPSYKAIFPSIEPDRERGWSETNWVVRRPNVADKDPTMFATGVGGPVLGQRFDRVVLDDIADQEKMATPYQRQKVTDWLEQTLMTRLTPRGRAVMIATRWHDDDPVGWAIKQGWRVVHVDALTEDGESYWPDVWPTPRLRCNGKHLTLADGTACWEIDGLRGRCKLLEVGGEINFAMQYRGVVTSEEAAIIKRSMWEYYDGRVPGDALVGGVFVDTAHTDSDHADYSVAVVAVTNGVNYYLVDMWRDRVEFPELKRQVASLAKKYDLPIYVEDTLGGKPLIQDLKQTMSRVNAWSAKGRSKMARVQATLSYWEGGNVYVPREQPWVDPLVAESALFPRGEHDDMVDAVTMALLHLGKRRKYRWGPA